MREGIQVFQLVVRTHLTLCRVKTAYLSIGIFRNQVISSALAMDVWREPGWPVSIGALLILARGSSRTGRAPRQKVGILRASILIRFYHPRKVNRLIATVPEHGGEMGEGGGVAA